ncbi:MAG: hypothetical protein ACRCUT_04225 [Spirochaetota bacterium]
MKVRTFKILCGAFLLLIGFSVSSRGEDLRKDSYKAVSIQGLRIHTQDDLIKELYLDHFPAAKSAYSEAARRINNYYYKKGYYLAITYRIEETADALSIFVDEGQLGKIIIEGVDDFTLIRLKTDFTLAFRIYHRPALERERARLIRKYGFKDIRITLEKAADYSGSFVQLDSAIKIPFIGGRITFFEQYGCRYNLIIKPVQYTVEEENLGRRGLQYGIKLYYMGITPKFNYRLPSLFKPKDALSVKGECSISYLSDFNPAQHPTVNNIQGSAIYNFAPKMGNVFTPRIRSDNSYARNSRKDIGLDSYEYFRTSGMLEPGFTLLSQVKIYPGAGMEKLFLFDIHTTPGREPYGRIGEDTKIWYITSVRFELEHYFGFLYPPQKKDVNFLYTLYSDGESFQRFEFNLSYDFKAWKLDIFSVEMQAVKLSGNVPFYQEQPISGSYFFGFTGKGYHTNETIRGSAEYMSSIYRDYLFVGPFLGAVYFRGSGHDLSGRQYGAAAGAAVRYLFWDQFEARLYAGRDYLVSDKSSGFNMSISAEKKF